VCKRAQDRSCRLQLRRLMACVALLRRKVRWANRGLLIWMDSPLLVINVSSVTLFEQRNKPCPFPKENLQCDS